MQKAGEKQGKKGTRSMKKKKKKTPADADRGDPNRATEEEGKKLFWPRILRSLLFSGAKMTKRIIPVYDMRSRGRENNYQK